MNLKSVVTILVLAVFMAAFGQGSDQQKRRFYYFSTDAVSENESYAATVTLKSISNVAVNPALYVHGDLSADWVVRGWGTGVSTGTNTIHFYHSESLTFQFVGFGNPTKISGTRTGSQTIQTQADVQLYNDITSGLIFDTGLVPMASLGSIFQTSGPVIPAVCSGGVLRMEFTRQVSVAVDNGPGLYQNVGKIIVSRN